VDIQVLQSFENDSPDDRFVKGLEKALQRYPGLSDNERSEADRVKKNGIGLFAPERGGSYEVWVQRPLCQELLEYASLDVRHLHGMAKVWGAEIGSERRQRVIEAANIRMENARNAKTVIKGRERAIKDF
jgi:exonuclease 3'-5' domain-containing protein 1